MLEVDGGLSEAPGQAQAELAGIVPALVVLIVCIRIGIADGTGIAVLEGHNCRHRQDQPVLEEALPEAKGILIIHAVVGALQGDFASSRIRGRIRHSPFP